MSDQPRTGQLSAAMLIKGQEEKMPRDGIASVETLRSEQERDRNRELTSLTVSGIATVGQRLRPTGVLRKGDAIYWSRPSFRIEAQESRMLGEFIGLKEGDDAAIESFVRRWGVLGIEAIPEPTPKGWETDYFVRKSWGDFGLGMAYNRDRPEAAPVPPNNADFYRALGVEPSPPVIALNAYASDSNYAAKESLDSYRRVANYLNAILEIGAGLQRGETPVLRHAEAVFAFGDQYPSGIRALTRGSSNMGVSSLEFIFSLSPNAVWNWLSDEMNDLVEISVSPRFYGRGDRANEVLMTPLAGMSRMLASRCSLDLGWASVLNSLVIQLVTALGQPLLNCPVCGNVVTSAGRRRRSGGTRNEVPTCARPSCQRTRHREVNRLNMQSKRATAKNMPAACD